MASIRVPVLRHLAGCQSRSLRASQQRRWAQVHDVRFLATTQQPRSVLEKYRDKLDRKAREEGHGDIDTLKKAYADKIHGLRKKDAIPIPTSPAPTNPPTPDQSPPQPLSPGTTAAADAITSATKATSGPGTTPAVKPLSSYLDLAKARTLPVPELTAVWRLRHAASPRSLCAVIPAHTYAAMEAAARRSPQFVLPVPHPGQGAEIHFLQWAFGDGAGQDSTSSSSKTSTVLFTQLAEYKARGEFAQPHTSVTHHLDLAAEKGVVLMEGTVLEGRGAEIDDARWLVMCLQRFYGGWDGEKADGQGAGISRERAEERRKLLEWFGKGDARFSVEKLLEESEKLA
ncbi:putative f1f0 atp synthase assembly protein [Phialemonium atrogriseum]|uniref:F1f0 atp synthase assembly protein n=1 Tax=Phialemonium atrogriseum TaxID=1093897 RepID=A0AAJ0C686_9PEZI|nr:putative f1f0 atp synthase assembly protein [Phialemonium atrogriseum]KAK1769743.1 putative f1f0 atp synthase assembly protein [Phialemonium atrogriseum]